MQRLAKTTLLFFLSAAAYAFPPLAEDEARSSSVVLNLDAGTNEFVSTRLDAVLGVNREVALLASSVLTHSGSDLNSGELDAGVDYISTGRLRAQGVVLYRRGPLELNTFGLNLDVGCRLDPTINTDSLSLLRATVSYLVFSQTRFSQRENLAARSRQLGLGLKFSQSFFSWLYLSGGYTHYFYDKAPDSLSSAISNPRIAASGLGNAISAFASDAFAARAGFIFDEKWSGDLSGAYSRFLVAANGESAIAVGVSLLHQWLQDWALGVHTSLTRYDDGHTDRSAGVEIEYTW